MRFICVALGCLMLALCALGHASRRGVVMGQDAISVEGRKPKPNKPDRHDKHRHDDDFKPTPAPDPLDHVKPQPIPPRPKPDDLRIRPLPQPKPIKPHDGHVIDNLIHNVPVPNVPVKPGGLRAWIAGVWIWIKYALIFSAMGCVGLGLLGGWLICRK